MIRTSPDVERGFCPNCGANLTYQHALREYEIDFSLVSLCDPAPFAPEKHIWVKDKLPWVHIGNEIPVYIEDSHT